MAVQTISNLTNENQVFYDTALLKRCLPRLTFYEDGLKKKIPEGKGTSIEWRKFGSLAAATTPLTEGTTPAGQDLNITAITEKLAQYGDFVVVSDVLDMQAKDPVIAETSELLGEQAGLTVNKIIAGVIANGTNVRYAGGKTSTTSLTATDVLTGAEVKKAVRDLRKNNIPTFADGYYHATISAEQAYDLMSDTANGGWIDVVKYAGAKKLLTGEIGEYAGVRFRVSSETPVGAGASDAVVHKALVYGKDSYGVPEIGGGAAKPKIIVKGKGSAGTEDPLDQRSSIGWKNMFACKRLNELGIVRVETGISA